MRRAPFPLSFLVLAGVFTFYAGATAVADVWLSPDWQWRVRFAANPASIAAGPHSDMTLVVTLDAANAPFVFTDAKADGSDLVVTSADGTTVLPAEIVNYDPVTPSAEIWFKTPLLSSTDNEFFLYYSNPDTTVTAGQGDAWTPEHIAVYHFADDPTGGFLNDSGPGNNFATVGPGSTWDPSDVVSGTVGDAWKFDGQTDWLYSDEVVAAGESFTISAWFANDEGAPQTAMAFQSRSGFWDLSFLRTSQDPNADLRTGSGEIYWEPDVADTSPHLFTWTLDAVNDTASFYFDGVERDILVRIPQIPSQVYTGEPITLRVGICGPVVFGAADITRGVVDEYRIYEGVRQADWIQTEFNNQSDAGAFFTFEPMPESGEVTAVTPRGNVFAGRILVSPNPVRAAAQLDFELAAPATQIRIYDVAGRVVRRFRVPGGGPTEFRLQWDGRDDQSSMVAKGVYYIRALTPTGTVTSKILTLR